MFADILKYLAHIIGHILNIFTETLSQYMTAFLKISPHLEPLSMSLDFDVKVETSKIFTDSLMENRF